MRIPLIPAAILALAATAISAETTLLADVDGDGVEDQATLIVSKDRASADLEIATANGTHHFADVAFSGETEGQEASLEVSPEGLLTVLSGNRSVGRNRWDQAITIVWKDEHFRLAAITLSWWDTLTPDADGNCEVNMLTGKGLATGPLGTREIRHEHPALPLADWNRALPDGCEQ